MFGNQELSMIMALMGVFLLVLVMFAGIPAMLFLLIFAGIVLLLFAVIWLCYLISINQLQPLINKLPPIGSTVWLRFDGSGRFSTQIAKLAPHGLTKGVVGGQNADVVDAGDFPVRLPNGNSAIVVYDPLSRNVNLKHASAWGLLFKKYKVKSGAEAHIKAWKLFKKKEGDKK